MATNSFVQVPPDSTGKKLYAKQHDIGGSDHQVQAFHLADPSEPTRLQSVDAQGQASVRFAEGSPTMDALGSLRIANASMVAAYEHTTDDMSDLFTNHLAVNGAVSYQPFQSTVTLSVTGESGSRAARTTNRYHYYLPGVGSLIMMTLALGDAGKVGNFRTWGYANRTNGLLFKLDGTTLKVIVRTTSNSTTVSKVVSGTEGEFTITVDSNTNLAVGMYVVAEGVNFEAQITEIDGLTVTLSKANHGDVSGNAACAAREETAINQADWNGDKLDGTGLSGMVIDVTKANFYWIDFAWLGVGAVRFGVLGEDGSRIVCHTVHNPNSNLGAYMQSGSLPIHYGNENTATTSGTSETKIICAAVYAESQANYTFWRYDDIERLTPVSVTTNSHILTAKPKTILNSLHNRVGAYPECIRVYVAGGTIRLSIVDDATLSAPTWSLAGEGTMTGDISNSTVSGGERFKSWYLGAGSHNIPLTDVYELNDEGYHLLADATDAYSFSLIADKIEGTTVTVAAGLSYRELR